MHSITVIWVKMIIYQDLIKAYQKWIMNSELMIYWNIDILSQYYFSGLFTV